MKARHAENKSEWAGGKGKSSWNKILFKKSNFCKRTLSFTYATL